MTDRDLSIKEYARVHKLDPPYDNFHLCAHNFFQLNFEGYWIENINRRKNHINDGWYIKEDNFFKELKNINRKLKIENLAQKN